MLPPLGALPFGLFGEGDVPYRPELFGFWSMPLGGTVGWLFCEQAATPSNAIDMAAVISVLRDMGVVLLT